MIGILPFLIQWVALSMFGTTKTLLPASTYEATYSSQYAQPPIATSPSYNYLPPTYSNSPSYPSSSSPYSVFPPKSHWTLLTELQNLPEEDIESFLPQLCNMVLDRDALTDPAIFDFFEQVLLNKCAQCLPFGQRVCGVLRAAVATPSEGLLKSILQPSSNTQQQRKQEILRAFHEKVEYFTAHGTNGLPSMVRDLRVEYFQDYQFLLDTLARLGIELKSYPMNQRNMHLKRALSQCNALLYYRMLSQRSISNLHTSFEDIYAYHDLDAHQIAQLCPAAACFSLHFPLQHSRDKTLRILRFVESECELLPSKDRAPFLVVVELLEQPFQCTSDELYTEGRTLHMSSDDVALGKHLTYHNPQMMPTIDTEPPRTLPHSLMEYSDQQQSNKSIFPNINHFDTQIAKQAFEPTIVKSSIPAVISIDNQVFSGDISVEPKESNKRVFARPFPVLNRRGSNKIASWSTSGGSYRNTVLQKFDDCIEIQESDPGIHKNPVSTEHEKSLELEKDNDVVTSKNRFVKDEYFFKDRLRGGGDSSGDHPVTIPVNKVNPQSSLSPQRPLHRSSRRSMFPDNHKTVQNNVNLPADRMPVPFPSQVSHVLSSTDSESFFRSIYSVSPPHHHFHSYPYQQPPHSHQTNNHYQSIASSPNIASQLQEPPAQQRGIVRPKTWEEKKAMVKSMSPFGKLPGWTLRSFIVKSGDDLRKEVLAMQIIEYCQKIFQQEGIDIFLRPYQIVTTGHQSGLVEFVEGAVSIDRIKKLTLQPDKPLSLQEYFNLRFGDSYSFIYAKAVQNFVRSLVGYSLITYIAQVRDRHNANLLVDSEGHLVHIDFGFVFGDSPGFNMNFESAPFKFTREYLDVIGGPDSQMLVMFEDLFVRGFQALQKHVDGLSAIVQLFYGDKRRAAAEGLRSRLLFPQSQQDILSLVKDSFDNWRTKQYDWFQQQSNNIQM